MPVTQISAQNAFELLKNDRNSILVDVRTIEEFNSVGIADADKFNNRMILLPWQFLPLMNQNPDFINSFENSVKNFFKDKSGEAKIIFMCRSGGRSNQAAICATDLGYKNCYNIASGFEGAQASWKSSNLPWRQK